VVRVASKAHPHGQQYCIFHEMFMVVNPAGLYASFARCERAGDKRIIPLWAVIRWVLSAAFTSQGETRSNMHVGGRPEPIEA
jgi:hypothetical protein